MCHISSSQRRNRAHNKLPTQFSPTIQLRSSRAHKFHKLSISKRPPRSFSVLQQLPLNRGPCAAHAPIRFAPANSSAPETRRTRTHSE